MYTGEIYKSIGRVMRQREYSLLPLYFSSLIISLSKQKNIFYQTFNLPVYRGGKADLSKMKEGDVWSWPTFTSTTSS